jgi:hypothetical protein
VVVGITSWGYACADPFYPGVYSRIADQTEWIQEVICKETAASTAVSTTVTTTITSTHNILPSFCIASPTVSPSPTLAPTLCSGIRSQVTIRTDFFPYETSWEIRDVQSGFVSASAAGFLQQYTTFVQDVCLRNDVCYQFTIHDTDGDGINVPDGYDVVVNGKDLSIKGPFDPSKEVIQLGDCNECNPTVVQLTLQTDGHGGETKWTISDTVSGNQIYAGGFRQPYEDFKEYVYKMNVCHGCYVFRLYDTFGDGMKPPAGFILQDGKDVYSGGEINYSDSFQFGNCSSICQSGEGDMSLHLDVNVWGNGAELSWRIVKENDPAVVVATDIHGFSTDRFLCLPRDCYVFQSVDSGQREDQFGLVGFEYWLTVDGESVVSRDRMGGNFKFGCPMASRSSSSSFKTLWNSVHIMLLMVTTTILWYCNASHDV